MEYLIINKPLITISQAVQYKLELRKIVNIEIISKPIQISTCQTSYPPSAEIIKIESEIQSISDQTQSESIQKTLETSSELFEISLQMALLPSIVSISTSIYHLEDKISVIPCIDNFSLKIDTKIEEHKERDFNFDVRSSYSFYSGMDTPLTTTTMMSFDEGFDFEPCVGFAIERFLGEVDGFFVCAACEKVVRKPKECTSCQNLMCKYCAYSQMKCPYGCEDLNLHRPSKFALIVYHRLKLRCSYFESGCEFVGRIKDMKDHELVCLYEVVKCQSQICNNTFTKKDKNKGETAPLVCSEMCESLVEFKKILDNSSREAILQEFSNYLIKMSVVSEEEIERELTEILNEKEQKQAEAKLFLEIKGGLLTELENRRNKNHPGKWNSGSKKWSCCNEQDKYSIGCRDI